MAKRRKTREEKKLADLRHNFAHSLANNANFEAKISLSPKLVRNTPKTDKVQIVAGEYPFLIKDLSKTTILTSAILAFQVILFALLRNHSIAIPGISY